MKIPSDSRSSSDALQCPGCGGEYLHHGRIEIYNRHGEDEKTGLHVRVEGQRLSVDDEQRGNPSERRHGVSIRLTCELCAAISLLSIQQHKGCTFLTLDVIDDEAPATVPARKP